MPRKRTKKLLCLYLDLCFVFLTAVFLVCSFWITRARQNDLVEMAKPRKKHQDQPRKKLVDKERKKTKAKKEKQPLTTKASIVPGTHGAERTEAESKKEPCTKPKPAHSSLFWRLLLIVATALLAIPVAILVTTRGRPQEVYQLLQNEGLFDRDLWKKTHMRGLSSDDLRSTKHQIVQI